MPTVLDVFLYLDKTGVKVFPRGGDCWLWAPDLSAESRRQCELNRESLKHIASLTFTIIRARGQCVLWCPDFATRDRLVAFGAHHEAVLVGEASRTKCRYTVGDVKKSMV